MTWVETYFKLLHNKIKLKTIYSCFFPFDQELCNVSWSQNWGRHVILAKSYDFFLEKLFRISKISQFVIIINQNFCLAFYILYNATQIYLTK